MGNVTGRVRHYGAFYRLDDDEGSSTRSQDRPNVLVYGNCQAEAIRILLSASTESPVRAIRIPPVFELEPADLPFLQSAAADAQFLVAQPVADDYRGLSLGTRQVQAMMKPGASVLQWPVVRHSGLHPWQAIVRHPDEPSREPPVVPYHDLRTLVAAGRGGEIDPGRPSEAAILAVGDASVEELRRRERRDCDVTISDLFERPEPGDLATINHPGNRILIELARRIQEAMGLEPDAVDPGRTLLGEVIAPVEEPVAAALHLPIPARTTWLVRGREIEPAEIQRAQLRFYADNPAVVRAGLERHRATIEMLGLA